MEKITLIKWEFIDTLEKAQMFVHEYLSKPIQFAALDTEFNSGGILGDKKESEDITKRNPLLASMYLVMKGKGESRNKLFANGYVFDLRNKDVAKALSVLTKANIRIVGHAVDAELLTLYRCGVDLRGQSFHDTFLTAKYLELGMSHPVLESKLKAIVLQSIDEKQCEIDSDIAEQDYFKHRYRLHHLAERYGIHHAFYDSKERLQKSFVNMKPEDDFTDEQKRYALEDARVTAELYLAQCVELVEAGTGAYLEGTLFPLIAHLTRVEFSGIKINLADLSVLVARAEKALTAEQMHMLKKYGLTKFRSSKQRQAIASTLKISRLVSRRGKITFQRKVLESVARSHPFLKDLLETGKTNSSLGSLEKILFLLDDKGYLHPHFSLLGAKTGRVTTSRPSHFDARYRQLVIPSRPHFRIFSLDVSGAEIFILAAASNDPNLLKLCAMFDVHLALASIILPSFLQPIDLEAIRSGTADAEALKKKYHVIRKRFFKPLLFSILYGRTERALAQETGYPRSLIRHALEKMKSTFAPLFAFIDDQIKYGARRGYVQLAGGLRIHVAGAPNELNRLRNNGIQAYCSVLFNEALLESCRIAHLYEARLLLSLYDGAVYECPTDRLKDCSEDMARIFAQKFAAAFPHVSVPVKIDIEARNPSCWNDGTILPLEEIIKDPRLLETE